MIVFSPTVNRFESFPRLNSEHIEAPVRIKIGHADCEEGAMFPAIWLNFPPSPSATPPALGRRSDEVSRSNAPLLSKSATLICKSRQEDCLESQLHPTPKSSRSLLQCGYSCTHGSVRVCDGRPKRPECRHRPPLCLHRSRSRRNSYLAKVPELRENTCRWPAPSINALGLPSPLNGPHKWRIPECVKR